jgi:ankyrin repeat protein
MRLQLEHVAGGLAAALLSVTVAAAADADLRLIDAVKRSDPIAVAALVGAHVNVNAAEADGTTALAWAAHRNDLETVRRLVRAGANVNAANDYGVTPLTLACTNASAPVVDALLEAGANANLAQWSGETPLMTCARTGATEAVKLLLARGADPNAHDTLHGQTPLMWSVAEGHVDVARALIERRADVNARSRVIEMPDGLHATTYTKAVRFRKARGGFTPLMFAARSGDLESVKVLLAAGAHVNEGTPEDGTPLVLAIASGHEAVARYLLDHGADPNAKDGYGITALHWALQDGIRELAGVGNEPTDRFWYHPNMAELARALVAKGANASARIQYDFPPYDNMLFGHGLGNNLPQISLAGATPFLLAAATGEVELMRVLVTAGADPTAVTVEHTTPLMVAAGVARERRDRTPEQLARYVQAATLALELGNDVNAANADGRTALHGAAFLGHTAMIQLLAQHGADLNAKDRYGQTAVSIAMGDPEDRVYRQLPGDAFDYRFRQPREQPKVAELLVGLGATPIVGVVKDRSGR